MRRSPLLIPALLAAFAVGVGVVPAAAYMAQNGYVVNDLGGGKFEVKPQGQLSDANAWCAAGDYAARALGSRGAPIYRISPPPRKAGKSIVFSLSPAGAAGTTGMATIGGSKASMNTGAAQSICNTVKNDKRNR